MSSDVRCPTPDKVRFATYSMAIQRANIRTQLGERKTYTPYACSCGWIHLTTKKNTPVMMATVDTPQELLELSPQEFRAVIACDVKERLDPRMKEYLRAPEVIRLWIAELKLLWMEAVREQDRSRDKNHTQSILTFQKHILIRRTEANNLRQRYLQQDKERLGRPVKSFTRGNPQSLNSIRREAFYHAVSEIINRHIEEVDEMYTTKLRELWPEGSEPTKWLPLKFMKHLRPHASDALEDDTPEE